MQVSCLLCLISFSGGCNASEHGRSDFYKQQAALLDPLPLRALAHGIPPSSSLKRAKSALLRSKVLVLLIALLPPRRILNSTISWSLQLSLPPAFTSSTSPSLFVSTRSSRAHFLVGSSTTCITMLSLMLCKTIYGVHIYGVPLEEGQLVELTCVRVGERRSQ